jgi:hypothetical protein
MKKERGMLSPLFFFLLCSFDRLERKAKWITKNKKNGSIKWI